MKTYTLLYRPPSTFTLPRGIGWTLVERPTVAGFERRTDLPLSVHPFGVISFDRELTAAEVEAFELKDLTPEPLPTRPAADVYTVAAYDAAGEEIRRWKETATHAAEACLYAERHVAEGLIEGVPDAEEYQAVIRHLSDAEVIAENYELIEAGECDSCGETHPLYATHGDLGGQQHCLPCVYSGLAHGRHHVAEAFEEELLLSCGYCGNTGHLASACPEQPDTDLMLDGSPRRPGNFD